MSDNRDKQANFLILVCDSRKAILIRSSDCALKPTLEIFERIEAAYKAGELDESDRARRSLDANSEATSFEFKSAMAQTDPENSAEEFARSIILRLERVFDSEPRHQLLIAAPPAFLGVLRDRMPATLLEYVVAEVPKHLTKDRLDEIASSLAQTFAAKH